MFILFRSPTYFAHTSPLVEGKFKNKHLGNHKKKTISFKYTQFTVTNLQQVHADEGNEVSVGKNLFRDLPGSPRTEIFFRGAGLLLFTRFVLRLHVPARVPDTKLFNCCLLLLNIF